MHVKKHVDLPQVLVRNRNMPYFGRVYFYLFILENKMIEVKMRYKSSILLTLFTIGLNTISGSSSTSQKPTSHSQNLAPLAQSDNTKKCVALRQTLALNKIEIRLSSDTFL